MYCFLYNFISYLDFFWIFKERTSSYVQKNQYLCAQNDSYDRFYNTTLVCQNTPPKDLWTKVE